MKKNLIWQDYETCRVKYRIDHIVEIETMQPESSRKWICLFTGMLLLAGSFSLPVSAAEEAPEFSGPNSVRGTLREDEAPKEKVIRFKGMDRLLKPYFDFKERLNTEHGFAFGTDYTALYQRADESLGRDSAAGGIYRLFADWTLFDRDSGNTGALVVKVENRHRLDTMVPQNLGFETGYAGLTGVPFSNYSGNRDWGLTNLFWRQRLGQGRMSFVAGWVDVTDYLDVYGMINPWTSFTNLAFLTSPTIAAPNQGLGASLAFMATENIYVIGGLADANGDATDPKGGFDTFFNDSEYFKHIEVGWTSAQQKLYLDNVHITLWQADERDDARVLDGWGASFSAATFIDGKWMPFLRGGYAHDGGALWEKSVSTGLGYYVKGRSDLLGLGLNWNRPSNTAVGPDLDDQYTMEAFYRIQLTRRLAVTPDVQLIVDPALNPDEDKIWVLGLRARLAL